MHGLEPGTARERQRVKTRAKTPQINQVMIQSKPHFKPQNKGGALNHCTGTVIQSRNAPDNRLVVSPNNMNMVFDIS